LPVVDQRRFLGDDIAKLTQDEHEPKDRPSSEETKLHCSFLVVNQKSLSGPNFDINMHDGMETFPAAQMS
jgi:hypothetical protein